MCSATELCFVTCQAVSGWCLNLRYRFQLDLCVSCTFLDDPPYDITAQIENNAIAESMNSSLVKQGTERSGERRAYRVRERRDGRRRRVTGRADAGGDNPDRRNGAILTVTLEQSASR